MGVAHVLKGYAPERPQLATYLAHSGLIKDFLDSLTNLMRPIPTELHRDAMGGLLTKLFTSVIAFSLSFLKYYLSPYSLSDPSND